MRVVPVSMAAYDSEPEGSETSLFCAFKPVISTSQYVCVLPPTSVYSMSPE